MIILFSPLCLWFSSSNLFLFFFALLSALFLFVFSCSLHLFSCFWYYDCITTRSWTRQDQWQAWVSSQLKGAHLLQCSPLESPMWSFLSSSGLCEDDILKMGCAFFYESHVLFLFQFCSVCAMHKQRVLSLRFWTLHVWPLMLLMYGPLWRPGGLWLNFESKHKKKQW